MARFLLSYSGRTIHEFTAGSLSDAQVVAQSASTLFGVPLRLDTCDAASQSSNTYSPGTQGTTVSSPSGVGV